MRLIAEMYEYCLEAIPSGTPPTSAATTCKPVPRPCAGAGFRAGNAISLLDLLKERSKFDDEQFERAVGRISFFVNAGIRFIEEMSKMRAFGEMWDTYTADRFGVKNEKYRRFRYGVQVNSLA